MAFSRMPKCRVRPYGPPFHSAVCLPLGMNEGSPAIVVLLDSARSAEPPQSSGSVAASAPSTLPDAARVARPFSVSVSKTGSAFSKSSGSLASRSRSSSVGALGLGAAPRGVPLVPLLVGGLAALADLAGVGEHGLVDLEGPVRVEAQQLLGGGDLVGPERRAVRLAGAPGVRRGPGDDGAQAHEGRPVARPPALLQRGEERVDVLGVLRGAGGLGRAAPVDVDDLPPVRGVAGRHVLAERDVGVVLDGDLVRVVDDREVAELLVAGERRGLRRDALHEVTVGGEHPDVVVEHALAGAASGSSRPR